MSVFTPTEGRILSVLADGQPHHGTELIPQLWDPSPTVNGGLANVRAHIFKIRKKLRKRGEDIVCIIGNRDRRFYYRHVRLLIPVHDGLR